MNNLVPNQKGVKVNHQEIDKAKGLTHEDNLYAKINIKAMDLAMQLLTPNTFKLWCYIDRNQDGYEFGLSFIDAKKHGVCSSSTTFHSSINSMIDLGYLVKRENSEIYDFYEYPKENREYQIVMNKD